MRSAFNIHRILQRYFDDPTSFRSLQAQTGTLVSGSTALQFFDRSFYPESDLDIYVHMPWRLRVAQWLLDRGYSFVPSPRQNEDFATAVNDQRVLNNRARYFMRGVAGVFTFVKSVPGKLEEVLKVQMIVAARAPMEIILNFHSSESSPVLSLMNPSVKYIPSLCDEPYIV